MRRRPQRQAAATEQHQKQYRGDCPESARRSEPEVVRIGLLGGFRVSVGSRTIGDNEWRLRKAAALVKLLVLASGHRLHREQVMELLWPDSDRRVVSNNLRRVLHAARKALDPAEGSCYLASQDEQLVLCPGSELWVDVEAFEEAAATARRAKDPEAYRAALDLYEAELLPEDRYEEWSEGHRKRLREIYLSLLLGLARLYEQRGENEFAAEVLQRALSEDLLLEEAHAGLMRVYALSGRKGEALSQYASLEEALGEVGGEPSFSSRALREEISAGRFPPEDTSPFGIPPEERPGAAKHNLPVPRTSFVGRKQETVEVKRQLAMTRLLTLTGAGGSGKTRLALEVGRSLVGVYPDGVWLVQLAGLTEDELVPQAVAGALGVKEQPGQVLTDTLAKAIRAKNMLVIMDNCEHLAEHAALLVDALLTSCSRLRILATSREHLGVAGETLWQVSPLSVPDTDRLPSTAEITRYDAVRLFLDRARLKLPDFSLTPANNQAVAEVCRKLEGIPLAIELATARMGTLALDEVAQRLEDSLGLLSAGPRTAEPRQRTMRATLQWSYGLLSEPERVLFRRLSVFAGGWTLEAAEQVGVGEGIQKSDVLELLSRLAEKSLVMVEVSRNGQVRYRMLEPIRQYAHETLEGSEEAEAVSHRHAEHFLALAEEAEPQLKGAQQERWLNRLEREHNNIRAALSWALEQGEAELGLRLSGALGQFWYIRGHLGEGRRWLEAALAQGDSPSASVRAKALSQAGYIASVQGDYGPSVALSEESLALSRKCGDKTSSATALYVLGIVAFYRNDLERASTLAQEAIALLRQINDKVGMVRSLLIPGLVAILRHDYEGAMALHEESLALAREVEDGFAIVVSLLPGAFASLGQGDHRQTRALCDEGLKLCRQLGLLHGIASYFHITASLAGAERHPIRSARLWGAAETVANEMGGILSPAERQIYGSYINAARSQLDEAEWEEALAEGRAMGTEEAIEYALSEEDTSATVPSLPKQRTPDEPLPSLTRREREVAKLVAQGHTNRQIASELSISEHTVHHHVTKILKKLHLSSREQVASRLSGNW